MFVAGDISTVVADIGTETYKIGYASTTMPSIYDQTRPSSASAQPLAYSTITDIGAYITLLNKNLPDDTAALIVAENTMECENTKKQILTNVMEMKLCNSIFFMKSGILDCFAHGKSTALILNFSGGSTQVCSVVDGIITCRRRIKIGGHDLTKFLKVKMEEYGILPKTSHVEEYVRDVKEQLSFSKIEGDSFGISDLYDRKVEVIVKEACELVKEIINLSDKQGILMQNILLCGQAVTNKIYDLVTKELERLFLSGKFKVWNEKIPFTTYVGGSIVGSMGSLRSLHIGTGDYEEYGESILERKKFDWLQESNS